MGSNYGDDDELPRRWIRLLPFDLAKTEVTVAQYRACVQAGGWASRWATNQWVDDIFLHNI